MLEAGIQRQSNYSFDISHYIITHEKYCLKASEFSIFLKPNYIAKSILAPFLILATPKIPVYVIQIIILPNWELYSKLEANKAPN